MHLLGSGVEPDGPVAQRECLVLERLEQRGGHPTRPGRRADVHALDLRHPLAEVAQAAAGHGIVVLVADQVGAGGTAQVGRGDGRHVEAAGRPVDPVQLDAHFGQEIGGRRCLGITELETELAHRTLSGCSASTMRRMPSRQGTVVGPMSSCIRVVSICTLSMVCAVGSKRAVIPTKPAR